MWESRRELLVSFLIVLSCSLVGAFSSYKDGTFARHILPNGYVEMTEENIEEGDPMAVYKYDYEQRYNSETNNYERVKVPSNPFTMSFRIGLNNLKVAYYTFAMGILFGIGTGFILISNGVMLGVFQFFFIARGLTQESVLTIWMHGTPEISAIVLAGAAGFTLGRGLLFPKTYRRQEAFIISAKKGITIMLGITPMIILAALIEGFLTRFTEIPDILRFVTILSMLGAIVYYFVIYPRIKFKNEETHKFLEDFVPDSRQQDIDLSKIKKNGSIYGDVIKLIGQNFGSILGVGIVSGIIFSISIFLVFGADVTKIISPYYSLDSGAVASNPEALPILIFLLFTVFFQHFYYFVELFDFSQYPSLYLISAAVLGLLSVYGICFAYLRITKEKTISIARMFLKHSYKGLVFGYVFMLLYFLPYIPFWLMILIAPLFFVWFVTSIIENCDPFTAIGRAAKFWTKNYDKIIGLYLIMFLSSFIFFLFINSTVQFVIYEIIAWFLNVENEIYNVVLSYLLIILLITGLVFTLYLMYFAYVVQYFSQKEITDAKNLLMQIERLGSKNKNYGFASKRY